MTNTTPIIRIAQLPTETEKTMSGNPSNTWFAIVNTDVMKTKKVSLESLIKYFSEYFDEPAIIPYIKFETEGGLKANGSSFETANLGDVLLLSDTITFNHANAAYDSANSASIYANGSFTRANVARQHANVSYDHANSAFNKANSAISLSSNGGLVFSSSNPDNTKLFLGQTLTVSASPISLIANNGLTLDGSLSRSLSLGQNLVISANPITINTLNGISGGKQIKLGETISLNGESIYNHANSSYEYANNCMVKPSVNYVTSAQNNLISIANNRYIILGDINSNIHIKLPAGVPKNNTFIYFTNMTPSVNNTIQFNGSRIHGLAQNEHLRLDVPNVSITMCYVDASRGWVIV